MSDLEAVTKELSNDRFRIHLNYSRRLRHRRSQPIEVGFIYCATAPYHAAKTLRIRYVHVDRQWRRRQIGTQLMRLAFDRARAENFVQFSLENALEAKRQNRFYHQLGFSFVDEDESEMLCPIENFDHPSD